jgi:hypothetical protein
VKRERIKAVRIRIAECGLRPIGAYAYAPAGIRKEKRGKAIRFRSSGCGIMQDVGKM